MSNQILTDIVGYRLKDVAIVAKVKTDVTNRITAQIITRSAVLDIEEALIGKDNSVHVISTSLVSDLRGYYEVKFKFRSVA